LKVQIWKLALLHNDNIIMSFLGLSQMEGEIDV